MSNAKNISGRIADLTPEKRALLERLMANKGVAINQLPMVKREYKSGHLPLSSAQERLWFLKQLAPEASAYNNSAAIYLKGRLDIDAIQKSLNALLNRHEVLRASFPQVDGLPVQIIAPMSNIELPFVDLSQKPLAERKAEASRLALLEAQRPYDLSQDALVRILLIRIDKSEHILVCATHHIISDGWSMSVFMEECGLLYDAFEKGLASPLPELPIQYADYVFWQRDWLSSPAFETQLRYWKEKLSGAPAALDLPVDFPRPSTQSFHGDQRTIFLPYNLIQPLRDLCLAQNSTLFMAFLSLLKILLSRWSGQDDVVIGTVVANRNRVETEKLIGCLLNFSALRSTVDGQSTGLEFLAQVRSTVLEAEPYQECPFERIVDAVNPERRLNQNPIYNVGFLMQNFPQAPFFSEELEASWVELDNRSATLDLRFVAEENLQGISLKCEYNIDLFKGETIQNLLQHFETLLKDFLSNPQKQVGAFKLQTDNELHQVLHDWNDTSVEYPGPGLIHELFVAQAAATPDAIAVTFEGETMRYAELHRRSNQLARQLITLGVGPDVIVGVHLERMPELIVSLLAILKAGGAYLPLDPSYPANRLAYMLTDAQVPVLLTVEKWLPTLPEQSAQIICLDRDWPQIALQSEQNVSVSLTPQNLAYVIYTSGSTGKPKGTMNTHGGIYNRLYWMQEMYKLTTDDCILQKTPYSFDVSVWELFWPLMFGARLVLARPQGHKDSAYLASLIVEQNITTIHFVPSMLQVFLDEPKAQACINLKRVICSGEALPADMQEKFFGVLNAALWNLYGPTEAAVDVTYWECHPETSTVTVPIGKPIANTQMYVLNEKLEPVMTGVAGELYIGGAGLGRGYLNRADLTAEKFVPDPFSGTAGARLYRTGDLGRHLADGAIEFIGRIDHQVKIRGFRIELGEIEATLRLHPAITDAVVVAREESGGTKHLVAYLVGENLPIPQLRQFLQDRLPEYMIPAAWGWLAALPLSPNGKIDRAALPNIAQTHVQEQDFAAPGTPMEEMLANIWADVLHVERVGIHDNFFNLGGHSLLATRVVARIREAIQVEIPLLLVFEAATLADLAERIDVIRQTESTQQLPPIMPVDRSDVIPLSYPQERIWFLNQLIPDALPYSVPRALRIKGRLDLDLLNLTFTEMLRRHEILRTTFPSVNGRPRQIIHPATAVSIPVVDLRHLPLSEREPRARRLILEEGQRPFDLAQGPLLRLQVISLADDEFIFILNQHHLGHDGWTQGVLVHDFLAIYKAYYEGKPSPLPELPIQYADFAYWQRRHLQGEAMQSQLEYWKTQLAGVPPLLELPTDHARPSVQTFRGAQQRLEISPELTERLKAFGRREGVTLFMTLLAAFKTLVYRHSGQDDICMGTVIANRRLRDIEGLLGMVLNTMVLRTSLAGDPTFSELLKRIRKVCLEAYAHQDLPFEKVVEAVQPTRNLSHLPLFQVFFAFQDVDEPELILPEMRLAPMESHNLSSKFDLSMIVFTHARDGSNGTNGLTALIEYSTDLYDHDTITRFIEQFSILLESVIAQPEQNLHEIPLLSQKTLDRMLIEWNETKQPYDTDVLMNELFEAQVAAIPDEIALVSKKTQLSYAELNQRANQLAHFLVEKGIGPEMLVGVCMERSAEMVIALLGILKAGGAYVPLDPAYPLERLNFIIEDARMSLLLTQSNLLAKVASSATQTICLDLESEALGRYSTENLPRRALPGNLAYTLFTSGSTGRPKGVAIVHLTASAMLHWVKRIFPPEELKGLLASTSIAFDVSIFELFGSLSWGGRIILAENVLELPQLPAASEVTVFNTVPSAIMELLAANQIPTSVRTITLAGEPLKASLVDRVYQLPHIQRVLDMYGPSEDTTYSSHALRRPNGPETIGGIVDNEQYYILDAHLSPVPIGVPGELYIAGDGLARGYLNRPDLTAGRFLPNPFSQTPGARFYKTGDSVRSLPDGNLQFLGRIDSQVKVHGFRIELGEIEVSLRRCPGVQDALVMAPEDSAGNKRLVAYVVPQDQKELQSQSLRDYLLEKIPAYMVPGIFVVLEKLPLLPNGKINRRALPAPDDNRLEHSVAYVSPGTENEKRIADVWKRILKVERVGIYDNFFDLGGHSLLVIQIQVELMAALQREIKVTDLFHYTTVSALAEHLSQSGEAESSFAQSHARVETRLQSAKRRMQNRQQGSGE